MVSDWNEDILSNIAEVIDSRHKTPVYSDSGYPMVRVVDVNGGALNLESTKRVSDKVYEDFSRGRDPEVGDLVISRVGSYGIVSYVNSDEKFCLGQNTAFIIPKINSRFLYYQLISPFVKWQIEQFVVGAVQKTISLKSIRQFQIKLPPEPEQKAIAHILGSLDDKIELNRQMNETLEAMAQALFKSWFVDFDPVLDNALAAGNAIPDEFIERAEQRQAIEKKDNSDIQNLFPNAFEFTEEMGWIPKGWGVSKLGEYIEVKRGGSPRPIHDYLVPKGLPWVKISDATASNSRFLVETKQFIKPEGLNKTTLLKKGSLILSNSATPGLPKFLDLDACIHDGWLHFPKKKIFTDNYLYQLFLVVRQELLMQGNGSVFTNLKTDILKNHMVVVPNIDVLNYFDNWINSFHNKIHAVQIDVDNLSRIRDTLLPKLMSGELRISDAAELVEEVV